VSAEVVDIGDAHGALFEELHAASAELAAAKQRYARAWDAVRPVLGEPTEPGARVAVWRGRPVARALAYTERRVSLPALRESWPEVAETVTEERLALRFTVEGDAA
jgi:hypothetical protein